MKVRVIAEIVDESGKMAVEPVAAERDVPDISEYGDRSEFLAIFDRYERSALEARSQAVADITKEYLDAAASFKKGGDKRKL